MKKIMETLKIEHEHIPGISYDPETGPKSVFRKKKKSKKSKAKRKTKDCGCK